MTVATPNSLDTDQALHRIQSYSCIEISVRKLEHNFLEDDRGLQIHVMSKDQGHIQTPEIQNAEDVQVDGNIDMKISRNKPYQIITRPIYNYQKSQTKISPAYAFFTTKFQNNPSAKCSNSLLMEAHTCKTRHFPNTNDNCIPPTQVYGTLTLFTLM